MKKITTRLKKNKKYILACSFGPDSMALLDYLIKNKFDFVIAHVNYHILEQAEADERGIREFAIKNNIQVFVHSTYMPKDVNEEIWAREERYNFFKKLAKELNINDILVAHNEGDLIETYLLQKDRGVFFEYGMKYKTKMGDVNILRPLLKYTKSDLQNYVIENRIPYSIDPSNSDISFKRNNFRNHLKQLNSDGLNKIKLEIKEKNLQNSTILNKYSSLFKNKTLNCNSELFKELDEYSFHLLLIKLLKDNEYFYPMSKGLSDEIFKIIKSKKSNWVKQMGDENIYIEYGNVSIHKPYNTYRIDLKNDHEQTLFSLNSKSKLYKEFLEKDSLIVMPAKNAENYKKGKETFKVNREFISWKLPTSLREIWPGIFNKEGELIYLPRYQEKNKSRYGLLRFCLVELKKM